MAKFDEKDIFDKSAKLIEEKGLIFMSDVIAYLPCSEATFYVLFPAKSEGLEKLKEILTTNKVSQKVSMRKKWLDSDNATLQMGLYKLIGTDEERKRLSQTYQDITTDGVRLQGDTVEIVIQDFSGEEEDES